MSSKLPHWQHGLFSACIFFSAAIAVYIILILPALTARKENVERIEDLSFQLSKFTGAAKNIRQLENDINKLNNSTTDNNDFLKGVAPAIIAANLQKKLKTIIEASKGNLVSTHAIIGKDDGVYPKVTIKVHMQVDMQSLQKVLYKLTINKPLLFTDNIVIQRRHVSSKRHNKNTGLLEVRFDVTGYLNRVAT